MRRKAGEWKVEVELVAKLNFDLANTLPMHRKRSVDVEVDLYRFSHSAEMSEFPERRQL